MRLTMRTALASAFVAVLASVLVASAGATTTFELTGVETAATATSASFQGVLVGQPGSWTATIVHGDLDKSPQGVTQILSGGFVISAGAIPTGGSITGGQLVAQPALGGKLCTQPFLVSGTLATATGPGSFQGTLTHYGTREHGVCNAAFASFVGSVTIP
jgi:hypothetical protein